MVAVVSDATRDKKPMDMGLHSSFTPSHHPLDFPKSLFQDGVLIYFAAFKRHIGVFPPVSDEKLRAAVAKYAGPKGNLQFPLTEAMPYALIARIVKARLRHNVAKLKKTARR